ncbi:transcriptional regulator with XRE-family HTH domain [Aequitasia blattaphilus]|uniref:Helix-turn-helix domain-containing protein n=1 Tax=Aequitasia blattaphilus TaxID=2949332 RepID=A0ABT1E803_9FIRM|nr:helix-turn-helix transcriptional regulator [Aequitasia blattaphilus]MCP1101960.1 helix-turn-helix domain-containing protein [Aequitasia blattaphilus]MCR8614600.1 helix-turn-helix domain-containing protein [Aequitasia blattaphilus]
MEIGYKLKEIRTSQNYTQKYLGDLLGVSASIVSRYESNVLEPNLDTLIMYSEIFSVSTDYILGLRTNSLNSNESSPAHQYRKLSETENDLLIYFSQLNKMDQQWILGQIVDLIKEYDNVKKDSSDKEGKSTA